MENVEKNFEKNLKEIKKKEKKKKTGQLGFKGASEKISNKVDYFIDSDKPHRILNLIMHIYHSKDYRKTIESLKKL